MSSPATIPSSSDPNAPPTNSEDHQETTQIAPFAVIIWSRPPEPPPAETEEQRLGPPFPFLQLPGELRNRIYTHLLTASRPIHSYWFRKPTTPRFAAIAQVNRQTNMEASSILYHENTIRFCYRTLRVPFEDSHPSNIIDVPNRFTTLLRTVILSCAVIPARRFQRFLTEAGAALLSLAAASSRLESLTLYTSGSVWRCLADANFGEGLELQADFLEAVGELPHLKNFVVVYGPSLELDLSRVSVEVVASRRWPGAHEAGFAILDSLETFTILLPREGENVKRDRDGVLQNGWSLRIPFRMNHGEVLE